ncbi:MAG: HAMP domain-containing sensor histidine kinase [Actinomycetes bacterium]
MSLRVKLVLAIVVLTTAATLCIGWFSYAVTADRLTREVDRSLQTGSELIEHGSQASLTEELPGQSSGSDDQVPSSEQLFVQMLDAHGLVTARTRGVSLPVGDIDRQIAAGSELSTHRVITLDGEPYQMLTRSIDGNRGAIQVVRSLAETNRILNALRNFIFLAAVVIVGAAAGVGWLIALQITRRLVRVTNAAEEVASTGRLDVTVPVEGTDEAGRLGVAFNEMLTALSQSKDAQKRLVQDAGHELRTPLTSLRTNVSVLRRHNDLPPDARARVLDDLDSETKELTTLVNELVELASDQREVEESETLDLGELVSRITERAQRRTDRQFDLHVESGSVNEIVGRPLAIERAVSNLLDNATKFDPDGVEPIAVSVATGRVSVCDRGQGIADADLSMIFERFFRSDEARSRPGSGLGLSIVNDIATAHGGHTFAEQRAGGGACVGFVIPVVAQPMGWEEETMT